MVFLSQSLSTLSTILCPDEKETAGTTKVSTLRLLVSCNHWASGNFEESREVLAAFSFILGLKGQSDHLWGSWFPRLPPPESLENGGKCLGALLGIPGLAPLQNMCGERRSLSSICTSLDDCFPFQSLWVYTPPKIVAASKCWAFALCQVRF